ncbi:MAG: exopolyphosphatase [Bacteroidia bacterium]|nr:exopolyphosphatase [Bacteroidia bacterium]
MKFAAIDIGSNAVRLQIARLNDNPIEPFKKVEFVRIPIRLGDDAFNRGKISKEKRKQFYKAMHSFKLMMEVFGVQSYMACATSALREANNGDKIVKKVSDEFDLDIEIINGKRESEIILKSITHFLKPDKNYLTIDVGGGSTEMTVIQNLKAYDSASFDVGTVRLLDNGIKKESWTDLENYIKQHFTAIDNSRAIATSGTINKIANIINPTLSEPSITIEELDRFYHTIKKMSLNQLIETYKLNPDRADVMEHSAFLYLKILKWAHIEKLFAPSAGLKDGILYELLENSEYGA